MKIAWRFLRARAAAITLMLLAVPALFGQLPPQSNFKSVEVHPDRTVTVRYRAAGAQKVMFAREGAEPVAMTRGEGGVWTLTTGPVDPDYYGYSFIVDDIPQLDPDNPSIKPNLISLQNVMYVPATSPQPWDVTDVPHGTVRHHFYKSAIVGDQRDYYVYTPPAYDPQSKTVYPVFYLLHGYSDDASGWTAVGRANVILDNLIAQGKAKPMIVVMSLGYGDMEMIAKKWGAWGDTALRDRNFGRFREALLTEVMPAVAKQYRVSTRPADTAIAGLSMGGSESLLTGLNNPARFGWIGAFSSGGLGTEFTKWFPNLDNKVNSQIKLLWISCGTEDRLIEPNRAMFTWLKTKQINFTPLETPGAHTWMVWRRNLVTFASLIFQQK